MGERTERSVRPNFDLHIPLPSLGAHQLYPFRSSSWPSRFRIRQSFVSLSQMLKKGLEGPFLFPFPISLPSSFSLSFSPLGLPQCDPLSSSLSPYSRPYRSSQVCLPVGPSMSEGGSSRISPASRSRSARSGTFFSSLLPSLYFLD